MLNIYKTVTDFRKRAESDDIERIRGTVLKILNRIREEGDKGIISLTKQLDQVTLSSIRVSKERIEGANKLVNQALLASLLLAASNIREYHEKQLKESWVTIQENGTMLGQKITAIKRIGVYVPGGTAAYPSSVLMNVIPAQVAGVKEIVMVSPPSKDGQIDAKILAAANLLGIEEIYAIGGAQAVAALAYGTETIRPVDKIVGPGNIYVALAKKEVFGTVGIDMVAGPSEIAIIADHKANPKYIAADLLSQAEHDKMASAILITDSISIANQVNQEIERQIAGLERKEIALSALKQYSGIILVNSIEEAFVEVNKLAPEHLEILLTNPFDWLGKVENAGAIFLGEYSPEPVGDYFAGPNHVLPTNGTARFSSPLSIDDFVKKSSIIAYSKEALLKNGKQIIAIAEEEGLTAHAKAIRVRLEEEKISEK